MKLLITLLFMIPFNLTAKEISLSFDDAPRGDYQYFPGDQRARKILASLKKVGVEQVIFYANPGKIKKDKEKYERLVKYHKAGHLIGNHTFTHLSANKVSAQEFIKDFEKADEYLGLMKIKSKYFRYPYLHRGNEKEKASKIRKAIIDKKYIDGYVTIDNYDWYMDKLFQDALKAKKKINFRNLKSYYVETLMKSIRFYDELSEKSLKHEAKHILLLHENDLAALFIEDLVFKLKLEGWKIITPSEAYKDTVLSKFPSSTQEHGQGRIVSQAISKGYKGSTRSGYESEKVLDKLFTEYGVVIE